MAELCWSCARLCRGFARVVPGDGSGSKGCVRVVLWLCQVVLGLCRAVPWFCQGSVRVLLGLFREFSGFISFQQGLCLSLMC